MRVESQVSVPVEQAQLIDPGSFRFDTSGAKGLGQAGAVISELGAKFKKVKDTRNVAKGIAEYNNIINTYNESLPTKNPDEYVPGFQALQKDVNRITEGMSNEAAEEIKNRVVVWNEVNRASLTNLAIKQTAATAKQEMPRVLSGFIANGQIEDGDDYIESYGETLLSPDEVKLWKEKYVSLQGEWDMEQAINIASETQLPGDIKSARTKIKDFYRNDKFEADPRAEFSALNRLNAGVSSNRAELTEARKAFLNQQSGLIATAGVENKPFAGDVASENKELADRMNSRIANNSMDISDGITYNSMREAVLSGKNFSSTELMEGLAGTDEAGGMSRNEYSQLETMNQQTSKLDIAQKERLNIFMSDVTDRYRELDNAINTKIQFNEQPRASSALMRDRIEMKKTVVDMIRKGSTDEEIGRAIQANFVGDSTKYVRGWFSRIGNYGVNDFTDSTLGVRTRADQDTVILDILKDNPNTENVSELIELFSE